MLLLGFFFVTFGIVSLGCLFGFDPKATYRPYMLIALAALFVTLRVTVVLAAASRVPPLLATPPRGQTVGTVTSIAASVFALFGYPLYGLLSTLGSVVDGVLHRTRVADVNNYNRRVLEAFRHDLVLHVVFGFVSVVSAVLCTFWLMGYHCIRTDALSVSLAKTLWLLTFAPLSLIALAGATLLDLIALLLNWLFDWFASDFPTMRGLTHFLWQNIVVDWFWRPMSDTSFWICLAALGAFAALARFGLLAVLRLL